MIFMWNMIHIKLGNHMMKSWDYGWFFNNNHSCYYNSNVIINQYQNWDWEESINNNIKKF